MSKRDKRNRFASSQGDAEPEDIDFQEFSEDDSEADTFQTAAASVPVNAQSRQTNKIDTAANSNTDDADDDDEESLSQSGWRKIAGILSALPISLSTLCRGIVACVAVCCGKTKGTTLAAFSGCAALAKKLAPYCTLHWSENDDEDTETANENNVNAKNNVNASVANVNGNTNKSKTVAEPKPAELKKADAKSAVVDYEDDEDAPSSRLGLSLKVVSAALAASILIGGTYLGYSKFFKATNPANAPTDEVAQVESQPPAAETVKDVKEPKKDEPKTAQQQEQQDSAKISKTDTNKTDPPALDANDPWLAAIAAAPAKSASASAAFGSALDNFSAPEKPKADVPEAAKNETAQKETVKKEDDTESLPSPKSFDMSAFGEPQKESPENSSKELSKDSLNETVPQDTAIASAKRNKQRTSSHLKPLEPIAGQQVARNSKSKSELAPLVAQSNIPQATSSSVFDKTASQFTDKPVVPAATQRIPRKDLAQPTVMTQTPVREITPKIPQSGDIQAVASKAQFKNNVIQNGVAQNRIAPNSNSTPSKAMPNEPGLSIPKDAVMQTKQPLAAANTPILVAQKTPPLGTQLKKQVQTLRQNNAADSEAEQKMELRFDRKNKPADIHNGVQNAVVTADAETQTLRFTPKPKPLATAPPNALDMKTLETLLPNTLDSIAGVAPSADTLPPLKNAPKARYAEINPAYRDADIQPQANLGESEQTRLIYQSKIASQVKNSPDTTLTYVVQPDDTYMTISDKFYGTSLLYTALAVHNRKLNIGWQPTEGAVIEIPTAEQLQANYSGIIHRLERRLVMPETAGVKYIVQEGDTLMSVAMDKLQNSSRWHEILTMNADKLSGPRDLHPGMEIMIPVAMTYQSLANRR